MSVVFSELELCVCLSFSKRWQHVTDALEKVVLSVLLVAKIDCRALMLSSAVLPRLMNSVALTLF